MNSFTEQEEEKSFIDQIHIHFTIISLLHCYLQKIAIQSVVPEKEFTKNNLCSIASWEWLDITNEISRDMEHHQLRQVERVPVWQNIILTTSFVNT